MILIKNRLIIGTLISLISGLVKAVFKILKIFHVRFLALMTLLGIIFYYTGLFSSNKEITVGYVTVCVIYLLFLIIKGYKKITKAYKKDKKSNSVQIISEQSQTETEEIKKETPIVKYPVFYKVKQNHDYVMAEYQDRYELYKKTSNGLTRVRTDYKEKNNDSVL